MSAGSLREWLLDVIARTGPMPVEAFMQHCLMHPQFGYYRTSQAIGAAGDFITAPEISQIFGELIGIWTAAAWAGLGAPPRWRLVELGPGRGTLMADLLRALKVAPAARAGVDLVLVEVNERLMEQQRVALQSSGVTARWLGDAGSLADLEPLPMVLIANEFLDALPISHKVANGGHWHERCVGFRSPDGPLAFTTPHPVPLPKGEGMLGESPSSQSSPLPWGEGQGEGLSFAANPSPLYGTCTAADGTIRETMTGAAELIALLAKLPAPSYHLYIDYGHAGPVFGDTLQAVRNHRYADPLATAGEADLSAQVDFAQLADAARGNGLDAYVPITQAEFLGHLGAAQRLERLTRGKVAATVHAMQTGLARLMQPNGMGGRFKVLALASKGLAAPPVF